MVPHSEKQNRRGRDTATHKLRIVAVGVSGGRSLTRPPISLDTVVPRTEGYTYAASVWDRPSFKEHSLSRRANHGHGLERRFLGSRAKAVARLFLEVSAGWASPVSRGLWDGDALKKKNGATSQTNSW